MVYVMSTSQQQLPLVYAYVLSTHALVPCMHPCDEVQNNTSRIYVLAPKINVSDLNFL